MTYTRSSWMRRHAKFVVLAVVLGAMAAGLLALSVRNVPADDSEKSENSAMVSFTFDDGLLSSLTQAAPTLRRHGLTGTNYVITNCVGMTTVPNSCRANGDATYMTWAQIKQLDTQYGWEVGSHGVDHQCLASTDDGCQPNKLTAAQIDAQLAHSRSALVSRGITATAFAPAYGDYDHTVMAKAAKYYSSMRGFKDEGINAWPFSDYRLNNVAVQEGRDAVAMLTTQIDEAIAAEAWVVFTFHDIVATASTNPDDYQFGIAELDQLAAYVKTKEVAGQIESVNVSDGLVTGMPNKLPETGLNSEMDDGWRTDNPLSITTDTLGNGSFPGPRRSVKLTSKETPTHLFSPQVAVTPGRKYLYKTFLNVSARASGEVAFYVDEYDATGAWISVQYRTREDSQWVQELNFNYTPSSRHVATASLQVSVAGTGITAYLDNTEMLALMDDIR